MRFLAYILKCHHKYTLNEYKRHIMIMHNGDIKMKQTRTMRSRAVDDYVYV